ncbi:MAG: DciA family protein [Alphaproteobacteria bacterium]
MKRETSTFDLSHFSKILKPVTKKVLGKHGTANIDLISNWKSIVGEDIGAYSLPQSLKYKTKEKNNATLIVAVKSSAFGLEINARKYFIIQKVNVFFGYPLVADLSTVVADIMSPEICEEEKILVSKDDVDYIKEQTSDVKSDELKNALENLGASILRRNQK